MKDTTYYNDEGIQYSQKRYPKLATTFTHFLFKRRLQLLIQLLSEMPRSTRASLLEVGCADGVVISEIARHISFYESLLGVDISPGMITVAQEHYASDRVHFALREDGHLRNEEFHTVVEVGVLNLTDLATDLEFAKRVLQKDGYYLCSIASRTSLSAKLKPENISAYRHLLNYGEYEAEFQKHFQIERAIPYGLFIPHIWKIPPVARLLQPRIELIFCRLFSSLFHETLYVLRKK